MILLVECCSASKLLLLLLLCCGRLEFLPPICILRCLIGSCGEDIAVPNPLLETLLMRGSFHFLFRSFSSLELPLGTTSGSAVEVHLLTFSLECVSREPSSLHSILSFVVRLKMRDFTSEAMPARALKLTRSTISHSWCGHFRTNLSTHLSLFGHN